MDLPVKSKARTANGIFMGNKKDWLHFGVLDKLTKMIHLWVFKHVPNWIETAEVFLRDIFRHHGFPKVITADRGTQFTSPVWEELLKFFGTEN